MAIRTTSQAEEDVAEIYVYGAMNFGFNRAQRYANGLRSAFDTLAGMPRMAREHDEFIPPMRVFAFFAHLIVYFIEDEDVVIARVLHHRQDLRRILQG